MAFSIRKNKLLDGGTPVEFIKSPFTGGALNPVPKVIVIHFTYGASARSSANWFKASGNPGSSAHVVVDRDGSVIQCVDLNVVAWHAGKSRLRTMVGMNQHAVGIELANWGYLQPGGNGWKSYTGVPIVDPVLAVHKNGNPDGSTHPIGWEPYPAAQVASAVGIAQALVATYAMDEIVGHDDISPLRKWDPGPAFDMRRFRDTVFGGRADNGDGHMRVAVDEGLNLRRGPGTAFDTVRVLPVDTVVDPIRRDGVWMEVSVMNAAGAPSATGWVHARYLADV